MKKKRVWKIPIAKEYEAKIGITTVWQRAAVIQQMRVMMCKLRALLKRNSEVFYTRYPNQRKVCDTCAFAPQTRRLGGFLSTSHSLMAALTGDKVFVCHTNQPRHEKNEIDPDRLMVCAGYALVSGDPDAMKCATIAQQAISRITRS